MHPRKARREFHCGAPTIPGGDGLQHPNHLAHAVKNAVNNLTWSFSIFSQSQNTPDRKCEKPIQITLEPEI
jgi:hypothetical protein